MTIEAISAVGAQLFAPEAVTTAASLPATEAPGAFDAIVRQMEALNAQMTANQQNVQTLATGDADNLHRVLMDLEVTKLQFELALQVRNKVLEAYQELMRMQV